MWESPIGKALEIAIGMLISMSLLVLWVTQIDQFTHVTMKLHYGENPKSIDQALIDLGVGLTKESASTLSASFGANSTSSPTASPYSSSLIAISGEELISTCLFKSMTGDFGLNKEFLLTAEGLLPLRSSETWEHIDRTKVYSAALTVQEPAMDGLSQDVLAVVIWQNE